MPSYRTADIRAVGVHRTASPAMRRVEDVGDAEGVGTCGFCAVFEEAIEDDLGWL